jgi:hypothetical protein
MREIIASVRRLSLRDARLILRRGSAYCAGASGIGAERAGAAELGC